ncbi:hypothetical protein TNCV_2605841 [Trichonephila clavipes]|nr:hypothetical protein TNCV_2605841 [Trichonephila clavipes]
MFFFLSWLERIAILAPKNHKRTVNRNRDKSPVTTLRFGDIRAEGMVPAKIFDNLAQMFINLCCLFNDRVMWRFLNNHIFPLCLLPMPSMEKMFLSEKSNMAKKCIIL